jgi:hypothetical protein
VAGAVVLVNARRIEEFHPSQALLFKLKRIADYAQKALKDKIAAALSAAKS